MRNIKIQIKEFTTKILLSLWILHMAIFFFLKVPLTAQDVNIESVSFNQGKVVIKYDLLDENPDRHYTLRLYSSVDDFIQPLQQVSGHIGVDIQVGGNKQIVWDPREEFGKGFEGNVSLELKGQVYIPFISLAGFEDYKSFKKGKPYDITWSGGRGDNILNFELYRNDVKVHTIPNVANAGQYELIIPKEVSPGKNYHFKISDAKNRDEIVNTTPFSIKRKVPLGASVAGGLVIAGGIYAILSLLIEPQPDEIKDPPMPNDR